PTAKASTARKREARVMARLLAARETQPRPGRPGPEGASAAEACWLTRPAAATPTLSPPRGKAFRQGRSSAPPTAVRSPGRLSVVWATRGAGLIAASTARTAPAATTAVASASAAPVLPGLGLVDGQAAAPHLLAAEP